MDTARGDAARPALTATQHEVLLTAARHTLIAHLLHHEVAVVAAEWAAREALARAHRLGQDAALREPGAAFVTLWRRDDHDLRGCRGECIAHYPIVDSITRMAIAAATDDPRFVGVTGSELPHLRLEISVLTPLLPIRPEEVVIGRDGLLVEQGWRRGLLLPQVAVEHGLDRIAFLRALCWKAGLAEDAWQRPDTHLFAFQTEVWSET